MSIYNVCEILLEYGIVKFYYLQSVCSIYFMYCISNTLLYFENIIITSYTYIRVRGYQENTVFSVRSEHTNSELDIYCKTNTQRLPIVHRSEHTNSVLVIINIILY